MRSNPSRQPSALCAAAAALAVSAAALLLALRGGAPHAGTPVALFSFAVAALRGRV